MDLSKTITELLEQKERLERVIATLKELASDMAGQPAPDRKRRGRKSMGAEERLQVSARMKRYWARRSRPDNAEQ
jgi:hypothetical protein